MRGRVSIQLGCTRYGIARVVGFGQFFFNIIKNFVSQNLGSILKKVEIGCSTNCYVFYSRSFFLMEPCQSCIVTLVMESKQWQMDNHLESAQGQKLGDRRHASGEKLPASQLQDFVSCMGLKPLYDPQSESTIG